jgi:hypothetical protein
VNAKPLPEAGNNNYLGSECDHLPEAGNNNYLGSECDHLPEAGNIYNGIHSSTHPFRNQPLTDIRGVYRFSSLVKQNKKAKNYAVFCFAGKKKILFYIYAVIVKQIFYKRSTNHYFHGIAIISALQIRY